ncbi:glycosyltransferase [Williamsia sp. CHRR-6]|nr:glycosyltransferase [Williamsia sp. CHRR-6]
MHVVPDLRVGGAERHVVTLMPALAERGHHAAVICIGDRGALFDQLEWTGVQAQALRRTKKQFPLALVQLVLAMRRWRPEVVLTRGYNADMLGRLAAIIARVPTRIVWVHHHAEVDDRTPLRRRADAVLDRYTTAYFGVAQTQRAFLTDVLGFAEDKVVIIRNGVDVASVAPTRSRAEVLSGTVIAGRSRVVGTVSAMRPEKDHPTFLRAAAQLAATGVDVGFLVVGDGPERLRTEALAAELGVGDRVLFTGRRFDVADLLAAMDVFVLSSAAVECFPMALLEAMAVGVPAVCTDVGGVGEMIVDSDSETGTGHLVPARDPDALARSVGAVLADPERAAAMGRAAAQRVAWEFSATAMVERTERALVGVTGIAAPTKPIRLGVVLDLTFVGGAEALLLALVRTFDPREVTVTLFCLREAGPLAEEFGAAGATVVVMPARSRVDPRRVGGLVAALRTHRIDAVLVMHHHRAALVLGRLAARLLGVPSVVAAHDMDLQSVGKRVLPPSTVATLSLSQALVLLAPAQGRYLHDVEGVGARRWSRTREVVIGNGIELPPAPSAQRRADARVRLAADIALEPTDVVIGMVARLSMQKAHEVALRAVARVLPDRPQVRLVIIGTGERENELRSLATALGIDHRVSFLGARRDVADLLPAMDLVCLSSVHEGVPMVLIEAMAAGVPVVATDCGAVADLVGDGVHGRIVPVGDDRALATALVELIDDPDLRVRLGSAGREHAVAHGSIDATAAGYLRLLREVTGQVPIT